METVNFLAVLWGVALVVVPLSLLFNQRLFKELVAGVEKDTHVYHKGAISFFLGLVSVLLNNTWNQDWMTLITLFGWIAILKGLYLMFWTKDARTMVIKVANNEKISYGLFIAIIVGLITLYFAFAA